MDEASNWILSGCNNVWSFKPGHGMYLFNKEGLFVMKTSRVLVPRVGN